MKNILFVCTANIARSPMAEALFNKKMSELGLTDQYRANSAGTWARNGNLAAAEGQKVMQARGLDTSAHRSRVVTWIVFSAVSPVKSRVLTVRLKTPLGKKDVATWTA